MQYTINNSFLLISSALSKINFFFITHYLNVLKLLSISSYKVCQARVFCKARTQMILIILTLSKTLTKNTNENLTSVLTILSS